MINNNPESKSLLDLYNQLNLPTDWIQTGEVFTINNLKNSGFQLPFQSTTYRPNYFSFVFVKDGKGSYSIDEQQYEFEPLSIYFTNPSNNRSFHWDILEEAFLITFDETFLKKYIGKRVFTDFPFLLTETVSPKIVTTFFYNEVEAIYSLIYKEYLLQTNDKYKVIGHLLAVLLHKIKNYFWQDYNPIYEGNRSSEIVKTFKKMLEKNFRDLQNGKIEVVLRVQDYADFQNLHPNYLGNVIKTKTGKNISAWIKDKIIAEAKVLLQNEIISIKEITFKLGFSETAHFSNYFKKNTGISPVDYRKQSN